MHALLERLARVVSGGAPTPLLRHLAGEFAPRIAGLWPDPHRPFVEADAERRHLICLALAHRGDQLAPDLAGAALVWPFRRAVPVLAPDAPAGLARALGRLGEGAWTGEDYRLLAVMLGRPKTAGGLRHCHDITPGRIRALAALSPALHEAGLGGAGLDETAAAILSDLHAALARRDGAEAAGWAAQRWALGGGLKDICNRAVASIRRPMPAPPFPDTECLRGVRTLDALDDAGGRYHNCLGTLRYAGDADYAYYEWLGEPGAMIEIHRDRLFGWTLDDARMARNQAVPPPMRDEITAALRALGVHVGQNASNLHDGLHAIADGERPDTLEQLIGWRYGD